MEYTGTCIKELIELVEAHKISVKSALEFAFAEGQVAELRAIRQEMIKAKGPFVEVCDGNESKA